MSLALQDKVILVTGGGAGIGRGVVHACLDAGATVVVGTLDSADCVDGASEPIERLDIHALDVADPDAILQWVDAAVEQHGHIDGLVANAGITLTPDFLSAEIEQLERLWTINQRGVFLCAQAVARKMVEAQRPGSIVTIASNHARASAAGYEMYAATKAGIVAMSRAMAWSLGKHGIRVNSLSPGLTLTETISERIAEEPHVEALFRSWHATDRYSRVDEIGQCAVFLLSSASLSMTGSDLLADQGMAASLGNFG